MVLSPIDVSIALKLFRAIHDKRKGNFTGGPDGSNRAKSETIFGHSQHHAAVARFKLDVYQLIQLNAGKLGALRITHRLEYRRPWEFAPEEYHQSEKEFGRDARTY